MWDFVPELIHSLPLHEQCGLWRSFGRTLIVSEHGNRWRRLDEIGSFEAIER